MEMTVLQTKLKIRVIMLGKHMKKKQRNLVTSVIRSAAKEANFNKFEKK